MSYPTFPTPVPNTGWNFKLPFRAAPMFKTLVQTPANNRGELRISLTPYVTWSFTMDIPYIFGRPDDPAGYFAEVIGFYGQMQGAAGSFQFLWPGNENTVQQAIGIGDGATTIFPMIHSIGGMTELIQLFVAPPTIYDNGSTVSGADYVIDAYGNLTFVSAPASGHVITWSGSWYYLCCFLDDSLQDLQIIRSDTNGDGKNMWQLSSLKFKSTLF